MRRILVMSLVLALAIVMSPVVSHAVSCAGAGEVNGISDCTLGPLTFDQFAYSAVGQNGFNAVVFIANAPFTNVNGASANLAFQIAHQPSPMVGLGDILLQYRVRTTGGEILLTGIDLANGGVGPVTVHERACKSAFTSTGACLGGNLLADLVATENSIARVTFTPDLAVNEIYILKDIFIGNGGVISDLTNSHELQPVPEPGTLLLFGSTMAALGFTSRKRIAEALSMTKARLVG